MNKKKHPVSKKIVAVLLAVTIMQAAIFTVAMTLTGVVSSINNNAQSILYQHASKRSIYIETEMLKKWSSIDGTIEKANSEMGNILAQKNIDIADFFNKKPLVNDYIENVSEELLNMLRMNTVNGAFIILCNDEKAPVNGDYNFFRGVFFKDSDPYYNPEDYSDLMMVRGSSTISSRYKIPLDMNWTNEFNYNSATEPSMQCFFKPISAAYKYPNMSYSNYGYWSGQFTLANDKRISTEALITYSVPLIYQGQIYGVIGICVSLEQILSFLPSEEIDMNGNGGYILATYTDEANDSLYTLNVQAVSGSALTKDIFAGKILKASKVSGSEYLYSIKGLSLNDSQAYCTLDDMNIYKANTPFCNTKWAVLAVSNEDNLFGTSEILTNRLIFALIIAIIASIIISLIASKLIARPIKRLSDDAEAISEKYAVPIRASSSDEFLCISQALNMLSTQRNQYLNDLKSERERYLIALQTSKCFLFEYDCINDIFIVYHFAPNDTGLNNNNHARYRSFRALVMEGKICAEESIPDMLRFLDGHAENGTQLHIRQKKNPNELRWLSINSKSIFDENGKVARIVASSTDITDKKLDEQRRFDKERRDSISGFYKQDYGTLLIEKDILEKNTGYCLTVFSLYGVNDFVRCLGSYCFDAVIEEISCILKYYIKPGSIVIRIKTSDFVVYTPNKTPQDIHIKLQQVQEMIHSVYHFDDNNINLVCHIGISQNIAGTPYKEAAAKTRQAECAAEMPSYPDIVLYDDTVSDVEVRAAYVNYQHFETNSSISAINSGYIVTDNIISYALSIFEKAKDINAALGIIFCKAGHILDLNRIVMYDVNGDFMSLHMLHQWSSYETDCINENNVQMLKSDFSEFSELFNSEEILIADKNFYNSSNEVCDLITQLRSGTILYMFPLFEHSQFVNCIAFSTKSNSFDASAYNCIKELVKIIGAYFLKSRTSLESRAKSDFLSKMSHEIRTPMNAIMGMTTIALNNDNLDSSTADCLKKIDMSANYLLSLINDILDMSRIESGKMTVEEVPFNLNNVIEQLDALIRVQTEHKGISFTLKCEITHPHLIGDPLKLNQILVNILGNAVKFTESGGVTLSIIEKASKNSDYVDVKFSVKDTGIGISQENLCRIFNSFEQAELATTRKYGGTGLGLSISSSLVKTLGGNLEVESTVGKGSEFNFTINIKISDEIITEAVEKVEAKTIDFSGKRVLIVEDDELNIEIAQSLLEMDGITVETAENGQIALNMFIKSEAYHFDAVLMDIRMPVMDGLTATKMIRQSNKIDAQTIPVIAMTANAFDEDMKKSVECGMNGHLSKPVDMNKIRELLKKVWSN